MAKRKQIIIGATDEDADWIKFLSGHKDEVAIHDVLAKKLKKEKKEGLKEGDPGGGEESDK